MVRKINFWIVFLSVVSVVVMAAGRATAAQVQSPLQITMRDTRAATALSLLTTDLGVMAAIVFTMVTIEVVHG